MNKTITRLRILGLVSFALYVIGNFTELPFPVNYKPGQVQEALMLIALASFSIIIALQLYSLYISSYAEEDSNDSENNGI